MLRMAHADDPPTGSTARPVPYLPGSGDLGLYLYRLIVQLEKLDKMARGVRLCSCGVAEEGDNSDTLDSALPDPTADVYADLCGVLAACGQIDALALVQGFRHPRPE